MNAYRTLAGFMVLLAAAAGAPAGLPPIRITAASYVNPEGEIVPLSQIDLADGVIATIGAAGDARGRVDAYPGAIVCPGLVDCFATLGVRDGIEERGNAVQPELLAADAFNRYSSQFVAALQAGVTTFALVPQPNDLIGGAVAVCHTSGPERQPELIQSQGPLLISLSPDVFSVNREPTSRVGAIDLLRRELARAKASADTPLHSLSGRKRGALFVAPSGADVRSAAEIADQFGLQLAIVHDRDARDVAGVLKGKAPVIVGPLDSACEPRRARAAMLFEKAGVPVALAGGLPNGPADGLRVSAAIAAQNGLSAAAARRAITSVPAEVLGIADTIGCVKVGQRADLVVFSGDPLDLRSRVLAVYVDGRLVFRAASGLKGDVP